MYKVVGTINTAFTAKDGKDVVGMTVHVTEPIDSKRGHGVETDHFFLSENKLRDLDFTPAVGQSIEAYYNKYGKIGTLKLISPADDELIDID